MSEDKHPEVFVDAVEEHSAEALEVLMERSSFLARGVIYLLIALLISLFIWSFYGKADVIITAKGQLEPASEERRVYAPTNGELIDIYVAEGMPISKNDLLARIKAPDAIKAAAGAVEAKMKLEEAEREKKAFPEKKNIMEEELATIAKHIAQKEKEYKQLKTEGLRNLSESQRHKLEATRTKLEQAQNERDLAKRTADTYKRLYETTGHGGVSRQETEKAESTYLKANATYERLLTELQNLELEFSKQHAETGNKIDKTHIELLSLRVKHANKRQEIANAESRVDVQYRTARAKWEAASLVSFEDLDQETLVIRSPVSGKITRVSFKQKGEKVEATKPLVSIAPADAENVLRVSILDKDRGFLKVGQPAKLKFAAFPFQRYGFIKGKLEYISPSAELSKDGQPLYNGRVSLERDYYIVNGEEIKLRYGMTANAEIVVQKRRLIDLALDPVRKLKS
ncbi:MAG: HlyD family efflux transporter periplasmic adaptor subunit [Thermodesulfobacteriota bacterium]|nr:HlyD family efflux transporter periplasmic adaptor subunit [Thermodesulfobacteriota bacterium]